MADYKPGENPVEAPEGETVDEEDATSKKLDHKHNDGAADLEKVTDYQEEKELSSKVSESAYNLLDSERVKQAQRQKELSKVVIRQEDVDLIVHELEVSKHLAEKRLREHRGNLKDALRSLIAVS